MAGATTVRARNGSKNSAGSTSPTRLGPDPGSRSPDSKGLTIGKRRRRREARKAAFVVPKGGESSSFDRQSREYLSVVDSWYFLMLKSSWHRLLWYFLCFYVGTIAFFTLLTFVTCAKDIDGSGFLTVPCNFSLQLIRVHRQHSLN